MKKKVYLASPFFNAKEISVVEYVAKRLRNLGFDVYSPREHEVENAWALPNKEWAKKVFDADIKAINEADIVVVINFGMYSDTGTAWECGYAYGIGKKVKMVLAENIITESPLPSTYSLMMINGCHHFENINDFDSIIKSIGKYDFEQK